MASLRSASCLGACVGSNVVTPVALPPGLSMLATTSSATGSTTIVNTIGMLEVTCLTARTVTAPSAAITSIRRSTSSATSAGNRAYCPSANRASMTSSWPS
jgi:hypothetical protein